MEADFLKLTQETKSIMEYEEQFTALSCFAPTLLLMRVVSVGSSWKSYILTLKDD